ncbi:hypothetical protein ACJX0J_039818, partial [Zea mays]
KKEGAIGVSIGLLLEFLFLFGTQESFLIPCLFMNSKLTLAQAFQFPNFALKLVILQTVGTLKLGYPLLLYKDASRGKRATLILTDKIGGYPILSISVNNTINIYQIYLKKFHG